MEVGFPPDSTAFRYREKVGQKSALLKFLQEMLEINYNYIVENPEAGKMILDSHKNLVDLNLVKDYASKKLTDKLDVAKTLFSEKELKELLYAASYPEPTTGISENSILVVPVEELVVDLTGISGRINQKNVSDLYADLTKGLTSEDLDEVEAMFKTKATWDIDKKELHMFIPTDAWEAIVDVDKFGQLMNQELGKEKKVAAAASNASIKFDDDVYSSEYSYYMTIKVDGVTFDTDDEKDKMDHIGETFIKDIKRTLKPHEKFPFQNPNISYDRVHKTAKGLEFQYSIWYDVEVTASDIYSDSIEKTLNSLFLDFFED